MRQLAYSRVLCLAALVRRRPKNTEDAAALLAAPSASLFLHTRSSAREPSSGTALAHVHSQSLTHETTQQIQIGRGAAHAEAGSAARLAILTAPTPRRDPEDAGRDLSTPGAGCEVAGSTATSCRETPRSASGHQDGSIPPRHTHPLLRRGPCLPNPVLRSAPGTSPQDSAGAGAPTQLCLRGTLPLTLRLRLSTSAAARLGQKSSVGEAPVAASGGGPSLAPPASAMAGSPPSFSTSAAQSGPSSPSSASSEPASPSLSSSPSPPSPSPSPTQHGSAASGASPSSPSSHHHTSHSSSSSLSSPSYAAPGTGSSSSSSSWSPSSSSSSSPSSSSSSSRYSEPRDGSFAGRIVQHDGNHAVHLLVAGTSSRDYNLRMVRCHARDELVVSYAGGRGGGGGGGAAAGADGPGGADAAVVRGENVAFTTFIYRQVRDLVAATFLPAGHPATTGANYVKFMWWQGVNNIAVTANSVLASTFMLYAVGLGAGSIPTAGALNWVLKDGMGQLGTLVFGKTIAHNFDVHSKTWFFLSAVMLQAAAALELLTVLMPHHFLAMGSLANTLKGLAWMAAGSTRSVFHLSFARDNNIADVTAKGTSQYIFASLVGTAGGALMCAAVGQSGAAAAACYGALAAATLASAYMAVQVIPLATLNATRLQLLVDAFLHSITPPAAAAAAATATATGEAEARREGDDGGADDGSDGGGGGSDRRRIRILDEEDEYDDEYGDVDGYYLGGGGGARGGGGGGWRRRRRPRCTTDRCYIGPSIHEYDMMYDDSLEPRIPTPLELSPLDPPLPYLSRAAHRLAPPIHVGSRLEHVVDGNANLLVMLLTTYRYRHFMVLPRRGGLHVLLHDKADPRDIVQAYLQACILRRRLRSAASPLPDPDEHTAELRLELQESLAAAERLTTIFMSALEANGWTIAKVVVEAQRRRAKW